MADVLPISNPLEKIRCRFIERRWMRAAKAWRCFIALPADPMLPAILTSLIEDKVKIEISGDYAVSMAPVFVVDVPSKNKGFLLVLETCYENQAGHGPHLTALTNTDILLTISPFTEPEKPQSLTTDPINTSTIRGLHIEFFHNERFWVFLTLNGTIPATSPETAKVAFKALFKVESCKQVSTREFNDFLQRFNAWLKEGK